MGSQFIEIIILAAIALFLILRLRNVLGSREGFEKPAETPPVAGSAPRKDRSFEVIDGGGPDHDIADVIDPDSDSGQGIGRDEAGRSGFRRRRFHPRSAAGLRDDRHGL